MTPTDVRDRKESALEYLSNALSHLLETARSRRQSVVHNYVGNLASHSGSTLWDRVCFSIKLGCIEEAPEPLRGAVCAALTPDDVIRCLVFGPPQRTIGTASPASLLAMLNRGWVIALAGGGGRPKVYRCNFTETLLVEITDVLLYGRLRFDFVRFGRVHSVVIPFNTVSSDLYQNAVQLMLAGTVSQYHAVLEKNGKAFQGPPDLPLKFRNAVVRSLPAGQEALEFVYWPPGFGRLVLFLRREFSPAGLLALTGTHLLFFSEGEVLVDGGSQGYAKYGYTVTYCPVSLIRAVQIVEHKSFHSIVVDFVSINVARN
jgi:hypothetical protein